MKNIKNCPTQSDVIDTIINNIDIRGINKNRFYVEICKLFNNYQNKTSITYNLCITHLQNKFNIAFNKILEGSTQRYLNIKTDEVSTEKTTRIQVLNKDGEWLIDYAIDTKNPHFYYRYSRIYTILRIQFSLQDEEIQSLVKSLMGTQYKMKGVTPIAGDHFVTRL